MSYPGGRQLPSHLRPSMSGAGSLANSAGANPPSLVSRINEKKIELENLKELRDLSAQLAGQMQMLEDKLATLANGTEAVAAVLSNWHNVLRAINMASMKIPKPKDAGGEEQENGVDTDVPLPQTLVRIPVDQAGQLPASEETEE